MEKFRRNIKEKPVRTIGKILLILFILIDVSRALGISFRIPFQHGKDLSRIEKPTYMVYYGELDDAIIDAAKQYDIVILHPDSGNTTREQVERIQESGTRVFGYISIGEDQRTNGMTPEQMQEDSRFTGDGTGPRVDPREVGAVDLIAENFQGDASPGGSGFASYYLDDNDHDGKPDFNPNFNCAFTNIGDPAWFDVLDGMCIDGVDKIAGIREILTREYGRGLGCDGLFLDTIDTCAPNLYTADDELNKTRFEWTAPGVAKFMERLKEKYPDKYILQNRGIFFYNYNYPHYEYAPRSYVDFLMYESYMLDSSPDNLYYEGYFADNKNVYAPKICAEADRPDGFRVLSLGYAEGPGEFQLKKTLLGETDVGLDILMEDIGQAQDLAGFSHYITDGSVTLVNDFVLKHSDEADEVPPRWSSVHNSSETYPREEAIPRVGIGQVESVKNGVIVRWDVAMDKSGVAYTLYYQKSPFAFEADPDLKKAKRIELIPEVGEGYGYGASPDTYPYQAVIEGLDGGETYYFVIRARDCSVDENEEKNTIVMTAIPGC